MIAFICDLSFQRSILIKENGRSSVIKFTLKTQHKLSFNTAGYEKNPFQFVSGSLPAVQLFPGSTTVSFEGKSSIDLPDDSILHIKIKKVSSSPDDVHNIIGEGSR